MFCFDFLSILEENCGADIVKIFEPSVRDRPFISSPRGGVSDEAAEFYRYIPFFIYTPAPHPIFDTKKIQYVREKKKGFELIKNGKNLRNLNNNIYVSRIKVLDFIRSDPKKNFGICGTEKHHMDANCKKPFSKRCRVCAEKRR